jgi:large subunit ribosomal protein L18
MGSTSTADARLRRKKRVRKKIRGTPDRPRLCVFRSSKHIYAQVIDDTTGRTLMEASTLSSELKEKIGNKGGNKDAATAVGVAIAERALKRGITQVIFDRNGFLYHGRVKALSQGARDGGLVF